MKTLKPNEKINLKAIEKTYGRDIIVNVNALLRVEYSEFGSNQVWYKLDKPITVEEAAATDAIAYDLVIRINDKSVYPTYFYPTYYRDELIVPYYDRNKPRTYFRGRLYLQFIDDIDTPVIVAYRHTSEETWTASYGCALDNGVEYHELTQAEVEWLECFEDEVERWYEVKKNN